MTFASKSFLIYFFPIFLVCYFSFRAVKARNIVFIAFSLMFYSASRPIFLVILLLSIAANFAMAIAIDRADGKRRYRLLAYGAAGNLLVLIVFKYTGFFVENLNVLLRVADLELRVPHITLPLGISFYTFHAISYIADVAKKRVSANRRFDEFMLYMSMFPQLVAGPIVRYSTVAKQLHARRTTAGRFSAGMRILVIGLAWKVLIADQVSPIADLVFDLTAAPNLTEAWLGLYAYAMQIYFDFGGYSAMAVGLGVMTGFTLPRNFRVPYDALSITAFWRRWHMSLSAWLRDYVYIPLGGSRGTDLRTYVNLWTVFLLCGLWHGASWTFVIWGAHHGLFLALERAGLAKLLQRLPRQAAHLYTLFVAFMGWVWFRAEGFDGALHMFRGLFGLNGIGDLSLQLHIRLSPLTIVMLIIAGLLGLRKWPRWRWPSSVAAGRVASAIADTAFVMALLILCVIDAGSSSYSPFLYYRF
ncbi:D-alanyl-lipoteichoic acid acyltransferase DltB, MBOAT superfamily [Rhizobiales bacterium GAS191]|nr:D-alanyl-lipoteichoic acid acyltransferase DltB, MBOAT superfamily [Rhizobiales bacterium GAS191]